MNKIHSLLILCLAFGLYQFNLKAQTYAALPLTENFENAWVNKDGTRDVPSVYWKNTPATGSNSWSRDDDGVSRGAWTGTNYWPNNPVAANGSAHSACFASGETFLNGALDLYVNFGTLAGSKALYFWYINTSGDDKLEVSVSTDGGTTFGTPLITLYNTTEWTKICVDLGTLTSSTGIIRFQGIHVLNFSSPISIDDVYVGAHSSTPIVADFTTDRISGIAPVTVNFTDKSTGDVTNWNWDFNDDGTVDATAQNPVYTFYTAGTYTTKLTSYKPGISASKSITITTAPQVYASLPFIEDFDHEWVNREGTRDVPSLSFKNNPCTGNPSWRRSDDESSANWTGSSSVDYSPHGSQNSQYSARFHSGCSDKSGTLDAFIDFSTQTGNKTLSFWYINTTGSDKLEVYLSTDGGVTFGSVLLTLAIQKSWEKVTVDLGNITSSIGVIRFKTIVNYDTRDNGIDIGIDNIRVSSPTEIPIDAYFTSDKTSGQSPLTVNFTDKSDGAPTSWEWDFNNDGVVDATTQNPSYTYSTPGIYMVKLLVGNSRYSGEVIRTNYIVVTGYAGLPYNQSFENEWVNRDDTRDVPDNFWKGNPATGYKSWSREDDGVFRGAWSSDFTYNPYGANGSLHSACFNSYYVYNDAGSIDLYVDFSSQTGEKRLTFWYINKGGNDKLDVFLSTDGGTTFGTTLTSLSTSAIWTRVIVNLGNITSAAGVLRFKATTINTDPTYSSIGLDEIGVTVPALQPLNADFSANVISGNVPLTVNFTDQSDGAPTSWEWDFNNDGTVDATTQNASYTYNAPGIYTVKLTASKGGTDNVETKSKYILVKGYSSLPFGESFENPWLNIDGIKDSPSECVKNTPVTGNNSWSRDDEGFSRGAWNYNGYSFTPAGADNTSHSARFHSGAVTSNGILDFYLNFSTISGSKDLSFWYINTSGTDKLEISLSTDGGTNFGSTLRTLSTVSTWTKYTLNLGTSNSTTCILRFRATGDNGYSDIGLDEIKVNMVDADFNANVLAGPTPLTVSFTDMTTGSPTSWKWDFNDDGVIDSTTQNPSYTYTTSGKYTVKLITSKTGSTDSIVKTDYIVAKPIQYATLPFTENYDNDWVNMDNIRDVPSNKWSNSPATGNNSWSREDDGVTRTAWTYSSGAYSPVGANGSSHSARIHTYGTYLSNNFDLFVDFSTLSGDKALYFWYINYNGKDNLEILLSTDAGATFKSLTLLGTKTVWSKIAVDLGNSNSSNGIIRFKATGDNGVSDIGIDEVYVGTPSVTPIIPAFQTNLTSGMVPYKVNFTDQSTGDVTSWKWDFNGDGIIESALQNPSYTYTNPGVYSVKLIASKSGMKDSIVKANLVSIAPQVYASVPFREGFDKTWISRDSIRDVPTQYFRNNPSSGNTSWSRSDDINRAWTLHYTSFMTGALGTPYSARFNSYGANTLSSSLDLYLDFSTQFGIQQLSFWYFNPSGTDKLEVYLSEDGGATFGSALQTLTTAANWAKITVDLGFITASKGVIRFKATGDGATTDIGIDEIVICDPTNTPVSANFWSNVSSGNSPLTVDFADQSIGTPSFWKWDFNNDGVVDATTQNPSNTYNTPGVYSVKMIAGNADTKDSTTKTNYIVVPGYASLPFSENFETDWVNRDGLRDVPTYYYKNNPATGNNSWSCSDDGVLRGAWPSNSGYYSPSGANNSTHSARFHSYSTTSTGNMDLFVNFSTLAGNKTLSFWYINTSGTDSLNVYLSSDGGVTDGTLVTTKKVASSWTKLTVDLGSVTTHTGVIRFKATGDYNYSDIGIDDITIGTTGTVAVDAQFSTDVKYGLAPLTVKFTDQSTGTPTTWKWDFNNDGIVDSTTQNPSFTFTEVGQYSVSLEASGPGTIDKETNVDCITVYNTVKADFEAQVTEGYAPLAVWFTDKSTGYPTTWEWDFDNNGTTDATSQNATYSFTQPGSYSVKLIVSNTASNDTLVKSLLIHVRSKASLPYIEKFDDDWKSYQATRDVPSFNWVNAPAKAMYSWSRDDDGVARGAWNSNDAAYTPVGADGSLHSARFHTYDFMGGYLSSFALYVDFSTLAGNKTLSFYYINPGGTDALDVYLSTNGGTSFGTAITTQTVSSSWTKVNVDLGNITSADGIILFEVSADLDETDMGIDELSIQTTGITPVSAQFTSDVTSGIVPLTVNFADQSSGSPTSWNWDFNNDGVVDATTQNPSYTFTTTGSYTVRLISSNSGSTDSESKLSYIKVEPPVDAQFTADRTSGIGPVTVSFTDQSTGNPTGWSWDFNDDGTIDATVQNPTYTYSSAGVYTVKLTVSKTNSTDTETKTSYIVVAAPVVADFSSNTTTGITPVTIDFTDQSTGNPTSWSWDFNNDGITDATTANPSYTFTHAGSYTICLTSSKTGSSDKKTKTDYITVIEPINADFVADKITGPAPLTVQFTDLSEGGPTNWIWDFDNDGEQDADIPNPSFTYTSSGTYAVKLEISKLGFTDTEIKTGYIVVTTPTGVDQIVHSEKNVNVYPNPTHTCAKVKLDNFGIEKIKLEVVGMQGTILSTLDLTGQDSYEIDFSGYARGIYYLKTYTQDQVFINKLVLQ